MNKLAQHILDNTVSVCDPQWQYAKLRKCLDAIASAIPAIRSYEIQRLVANVNALAESVKNAQRQLDLDQYPGEPISDIAALTAESLKVLPGSHQAAIDYWIAIAQIIDYGVSDDG